MQKKNKSFKDFKILLILTKITNKRMINPNPNPDINTDSCSAGPYRPSIRQ